MSSLPRTARTSGTGSPYAAHSLPIAHYASESADDDGLDDDARLSNSPEEELSPAEDGLDDSDRELNIQLAQNAFDNEVSLRSSYLMKKGGKRRTWKRRWFVLKPTRLCYYKNDKEYELLGMINVELIEFVSSVEHRKRAHTFIIVTKKRTYYVQAASETDLHEWTSAINLAKEKLSVKSALKTNPHSGSASPLLFSSSPPPGSPQLIPSKNRTSPPEQTTATRNIPTMPTTVPIAIVQKVDQRNSTGVRLRHPETVATTSGPITTTTGSLEQPQQSGLNTSVTGNDSESVISVHSTTQHRISMSSGSGIPVDNIAKSNISNINTTFAN